MQLVYPKSINSVQPYLQGMQYDLVGHLSFPICLRMSNEGELIINMQVDAKILEMEVAKLLVVIGNDDLMKSEVTNDRSSDEILSILLNDPSYWVCFDPNKVINEYY